MVYLFEYSNSSPSPSSTSSSHHHHHRHCHHHRHYGRYPHRKVNIIKRVSNSTMTMNNISISASYLESKNNAPHETKNSAGFSIYDIKAIYADQLHLGKSIMDYDQILVLANCGQYFIPTGYRGRQTMPWIRLPRKARHSFK